MPYCFNNNKSKAQLKDQFRNMNATVSNVTIPANTTQTITAQMPVPITIAKPIALRGSSMSPEMYDRLQICNVALYTAPGEPDRYIAVFTVRNTSNASATVSLTAYITGVTA